MATVTKKFRDDFETWAAHRIATGQWTEQDVEEMRETLRQDLSPGSDHLRAGLTIVVDGVEIPAAINDHEERYRLWVDYFEGEAEAIRVLTLKRNASGRRSCP